MCMFTVHEEDNRHRDGHESGKYYNRLTQVRDHEEAGAMSSLGRWLQFLASEAQTKEKRAEDRLSKDLRSPLS